MPSMNNEPRESQVAYELSLADFRRPNKLALIPNDATVRLTVPEAGSFFAAGSSFEAAVFTSRGKVPGSEVPLPPIALMSATEFFRLQAQLDGKIKPEMVAWYDSTVEAIEARLPGVREKLLAKVELKGVELKRFFGSIWHEAVHARGGNEFDAYFEEGNFLRRIGVEPDLKTPLEIMRHVQRHYNESEITDAQDSFLRVASPDESRIYFQELEDPTHRGARGLGDFPEEWE